MGLFSGSKAPPPLQSFEIKTDSRDHSFKYVRPVGAAASSAPVLTILKHTFSKPNYTLLWGGPPASGGNKPSASDQSRIAGTADVATFGSKAEGTVRGSPMRVKMSTFGSDCAVDTPTLGNLSWKRDEKTAIGLELYDDSKRQLIAKLRVGENWGGSDKILEIYVPCDDYFVDVAVLSAMIVRELTKGQR